jgi:hypothetical protein
MISFIVLVCELGGAGLGMFTRGVRHYRGPIKRALSCRLNRDLPDPGTR